MTKLNPNHFHFLNDSDGYKGGTKVCTLSVNEVDKFCFTMTPIINCMNWKNKSQQQNVRKIVEFMNRVAEEARQDCSSVDLPFNL
jgi:hypothetical protein